MITYDLIMSAPGGPPCSDWTPERINAALSRLDCSSWVAAAESARADRWRTVSLADLRLTAYRVATREQRIAGVRRSVSIRIMHDRRRFGDRADDHTLGVWGELERWCSGDDAVDLAALRDAADAAYAAAYAAAAYAADAAADAAAYVAAYAAYAAADAADEREKMRIKILQHGLLLFAGKVDK